MKLRSLLLACHSWVGLVLGLLILFVAITGATLAFRSQFEARELPKVTATTRALSLDEIVAPAVAAHPSGELNFVRYEAGQSAAVRLYFSDKVTIFVDPATGAILSRETERANFFGGLQEFHSWQFMNQGDIPASICALAVAFLAATGIYLWWPSSVRALRAGLTLNPRLRNRPRLLNWHRTFGIYAALFLLVSAITGLPVASVWVRNGIYRLSGSAVPATPKVPEGAATVRRSLNQYAATIASLVPDAQQTTLRFRKNGIVECYTIASDAPHPNARSVTFLDASTGAVLGFTPYAKSSLGHKIFFWMLSLHVGQVGGIYGQAALFCGAILAPVLIVTGALSYLRRPAKK